MHYRQLTATKDGISCSHTVIPSAVGMLILLVTAGICFLGATGCGGEDTTWTTEAPSLDGRWLASARTVETSGFGTGDIETDVFLKWTKDSKPPEHILGFIHDPKSQSKTIDLSMKWVTPSHLEVAYNGHATVDLQVVRYGDVDISLRDSTDIEVPSPDGHWLASVHTTRSFGVGTPGEETSVYLQQAGDSPSRERVLGLSHDVAFRSNTMNPSVKWVTPMRLEVAYDGQAKVDFQLAKYAGIEISIRDLSTEKINSIHIP
jgi:hypothetical protein